MMPFFYFEIILLSRINPYLLLGIFSLLLYLPGLFNLPVLDRDEAHFAQASRQMIQTGHYFQIRYQEKTRFQKPPGINWLQAASVRLFSEADAPLIWPYRIPSLLGALLSVFLTFFFARRFVSERAALLASAFLGSALLMVVETHMAVIDTSLLSSVLLMQGALWVIYQESTEKRQAHWGWAGLFWLAMAYGFVLKGVTPLVGVLSVVALCIIERGVAWLRALRIYRGLILFVGLSLIWVMLVNAAENSNYLLQMFKKDLLPKLSGGHESHGKPPLFHLIILPLTFWPASLFLWQGGAYAVNQRHQNVVRFLLAWILPTWIFFEVMPTKLPQYVLPTFPAIAILCALAITDLIKGIKPNRLLRLLQVLWGVLSVGLAIVLFAIPCFLMHEVSVLNLLLLIVLTMMSIVCVYFAHKGSYRHASILVLCTALLIYPLIFSAVLPRLKPLWISRNLVQLIHQENISERNPLLVVGYGEPSLVFYLNTNNVLFMNNSQALKRMRANPDSILLLGPDSYTQLEYEFGHLDVIARSKGFNYNSGGWIELVLVRKPRN